MRLNSKILIEAGVAAALALAVQAAQIAAVGYGSDRDGDVYLDYAHRWSLGEVPYVDFQNEYPPGAMILFIAPYLFTGMHFKAYRAAFAFEMALFNIAAVLLVLAHARRRWPDSLLKRAGAVVMYLLMTGILTRLVHRRFDLAPVALVMGALLVRPVIGAGLLGVAASMKFWPAMFLPLLFADVRKETWRRAALGAAAFAAGTLLPAFPFIIQAGAGVLNFLRYHADRGIQVESFWALPLTVLHSLNWVKADWNWEYGSNNVTSAADAWVIPISTFALIVLVLTPLAVLRARGDPASPEARFCAAAAMVMGFLIGSKVLSPQFMLWAAPLLAITALDRPWEEMIVATALSLLAAALTMIIFKFFYAKLCAGPRALAYVVSFIRLAVFIGLYWLTLIPARQHRLTTA